MTNHSAVRRASSAIRFVLVHEQAHHRFPERVDGVLSHFPDADVHFASDLTAETIDRHFQKAFPRAQIEKERKTPSAISAGKRFLVIGQTEKQKSVEKFTDSKGMVCHGFFNINVMVNGCIYNCQYCFLQEHIWDKDVSSYMKLHVNYEDILDDMKNIARERMTAGLETRFQMGVLMDSLGLEEATHFVEFLAPHLGDDVFAKSTVKLGTKGDDIRVLIEAAARYPWATERFRPGWSINTPYAARAYEHGTASSDLRLQKARELQDAGYVIRFRVDPIVPYEGWEKDYTRLIDSIYVRYGIRPHTMVVASLRFDEDGLIRTAKERFPNSDLFGYDFPKEDRAKFRLPFEQRMKIFRTMIDRIRKHNPDQEISVCKENMKTWRTLGMDPSCSCLKEPCLENTMDQFILD